MEWTRFLYLLSEATSASHYSFHQTFTGYIMFIVAIWTLSFSCCVIHLVKISKSILARWQITFSALQANKKISVYRECLSKENAVLFKHQLFIYSFIAKKRRSVFSRRRVNLNGGGVKLRGFAERWPNGITKFFWQALFNAYRWLNIFKTLWFKIIITNYNRDMKFG